MRSITVITALTVTLHSFAHPLDHECRAPALCGLWALGQQARMPKQNKPMFRTGPGAIGNGARLGALWGEVRL